MKELNLKRRDQHRVGRRRVLGAVGAGAMSIALAGCSFSYSSDENRIGSEETFEFEADEGEEITVRISGTDFGDDDDGPGGLEESGQAELTGPGGERLIELSFSGDGLSDEASVTAPDTGTYEFFVEPGVDTLRVYVDVGDEEVVG